MPYFSNWMVTNKKRITWQKSLVMAIIFFTILLLLNYFRPGIQNIVHNISSPFGEKIWPASQSSSGFFTSLFQASQISKENYNLRKENERLVAEIILVQSEQKIENLQENTPYNFKEAGLITVLSSIVASDEMSALIINKGSEDGIENNMPVVNENNILVGRIQETYKNFSKLILLQHPESVINVKIVRPSLQEDVVEEESLAVLRGLLGGLIVDLIPVEKNIEQGDVVITSILESNIPKNIIIGKVVYIEKNDQLPFQKAKIEPYIKISELEQVFVITDYIE